MEVKKLKAAFRGCFLNASIRCQPRECLKKQFNAVKRESEGRIFWALSA